MGEYIRETVYAGVAEAAENGAGWAYLYSKTCSDPEPYGPSTVRVRLTCGVSISTGGRVR